MNLATRFALDGPVQGMGRRRLQQAAKLLRRHTSVARDTAHGEGVDGIVPRNGENPSAIGHYDVLALADDTEAGFLEGTNCIKVVYTSDFRQGYTVTSISRISSPRSCSSTTDT